MSEITRETTMIFDLPHDLIIEEIFLRVPMISLRRLRSTCKRLKDLLKDPGFIEKQIANAKTTRQYHVLVVVKFRVYAMCSYIHGKNMNVAPLFKRGLHLIDPHRKSEVDLSHAFHCDGILLCTTKGNMFVVWNLFSGQTQWIITKNPLKINNTYALGYDKNELCHSYKILNLDRYKKKLEIYEFTSDSWRNLHAIIPKGCLKSRGVSLKGNVYWLFKRRGVNEYSLLSFDFSTETFQLLYVPFHQEADCFDAMALSVVREEHLSLLFQSVVTQKMEIWITNEIETTSVSWNKFLTVDFKPHPHMFSRSMSFFIDEEKKVAVCCEKDQEKKIFNKVYIVGEDEFKVSPGFGFIDCRGIYSCPTMFGYVPRLL
ncbi:putative F-box protein At3g17560 [Arabidopsis lyrata subsp. lyrata]|uniref:putative F-box protein At3g17560 n=1 Tax=Arabidopsis lyrata subsp. lyrata TaxID=81972 RepID=UPI000A29E91B|nr:putative F-box protein At3g17560 [Arabidopsis lyrata subsp. lyrata]|eukprot:XP_020866561.1 putative F-box protein At3g17560 [Arabidopsis lyrata subsp. lyrata]